jgi:AcrR family transcriptional regulator
VSGRRQEILDTALAIADERGLDGVSMRTVAERVGVTPMALYRHFDSKRALLDGMVERLVTSLLQERATGTWDERLTALAHAYRGLAQRHPWSAQLLFSRPTVTPDAVRVTEFISAALREAGVPEPHVGRLERLVSTFVIGYAASEVLGRFTHRTVDFSTEFEADLADLKRLIQEAGNPET